MGSKEKDKFNKEATSKEGEAGRLQQRSQPSCYFLSPHQVPSRPHRLSTGSSYKGKNTPCYSQPDGVLAEAQPAIRFWGSFHKYFYYLLTDSQWTEFSLPSQGPKTCAKGGNLYRKRSKLSVTDGETETQREREKNLLRIIQVSGSTEPRAQSFRLGNNIQSSLQSMPRREKCIKN